MAKERRKAVTARSMTILVRIRAWGVGDTIFRPGALVKMGAVPPFLYPIPIKKRLTPAETIFKEMAILMRFLLKRVPPIPISINKIVVRKRESTIFCH